MVPPVMTSGSKAASLVGHSAPHVEQAAMMRQQAQVAPRSSVRSAVRTRAGVNTLAATDMAVGAGATAAGLVDAGIALSGVAGFLGGGVNWVGKLFTGNDKGNALGNALQAPNGLLNNEPFRVGTTLRNELWHTSMAVGSTAQTYYVGRSFFKEKALMRKISADMASDRKARGLAPVRNSAPLAEAKRGSWIEHGIRGVMTAASMVFSLGALKRGQLSKAANMFFVGSTFVNMGMGMMLEKHALYQMYEPFDQIQKHGQATEEHYARFLWNISKELQGRKELGQAVTMDLAKHYKEQGATAARILNDMADGTLKHLITEKLAVADAAQPAAAAQQAEHSFVAGLNGKGQKEYKTVGQFTGMEAQRQQQLAEHKL